MIFYFNKDTVRCWKANVPELVLVVHHVKDQKKKTKTHELWSNNFIKHTKAICIKVCVKSSVDKL